VVVTSNNACGCQHIAIPLGDRQDITDFGMFPPLIGDAFPAFFGKTMAAIPIELGQVQLLTNTLDAMLPALFQTAIPTPFLKVIVHRLATAATDSLYATDTKSG